MPIKAEWVAFKLENIRLLPSNLMGVYECGHKRGNKVLYIGKGNIRARLLAHAKEKEFGIATHFRKRRADNPDDAEDRLLSEYKRKYGKLPLLNKNKPSGDQWKGILY